MSLGDIGGGGFAGSSDDFIPPYLVPPVSITVVASGLVGTIETSAPVETDGFPTEPRGFPRPVGGVGIRGDLIADGILFEDGDALSIDPSGVIYGPVDGDFYEGCWIQVPASGAIASRSFDPPLDASASEWFAVGYRATPSGMLGRLSITARDRRTRLEDAVFTYDAEALVEGGGAIVVDVLGIDAIKSIALDFSGSEEPFILTGYVSGIYVQHEVDCLFDDLRPREGFASPSGWVESSRFGPTPVGGTFIGVDDASTDGGSSLFVSGVLAAGEVLAVEKDFELEIMDFQTAKVLAFDFAGPDSSVVSGVASMRCEIVSSLGKVHRFESVRAAPGFHRLEVSLTDAWREGHLEDVRILAFGVSGVVGPVEARFDRFGVTNVVDQPDCVRDLFGIEIPPKPFSLFDSFEDRCPWVPFQVGDAKPTTIRFDDEVNFTDGLQSVEVRSSVGPSGVFGIERTFLEPVSVLHQPHALRVDAWSQLGSHDVWIELEDVDGRYVRTASKPAPSGGFGELTFDVEMAFNHVDTSRISKVRMAALVNEEGVAVGENASVVILGRPGRTWGAPNLMAVDDGGRTSIVRFDNLRFADLKTWEAGWSWFDPELPPPTYEVLPPIGGGGGGPPSAGGFPDSLDSVEGWTVFQPFPSGNPVLVADAADKMEGDASFALSVDGTYLGLFPTILTGPTISPPQDITGTTDFRIWLKGATGDKVAVSVLDGSGNSGGLLFTITTPSTWVEFSGSPSYDFGFDFTDVVGLVFTVTPVTPSSTVRLDHFRVEAP